MRTGETLAADLIVLATGYKGQEHLVSKLFGDDVAARVGPIWGFGGGQELRNMFTRTGQPGLWFIAGSFAQCRIYSKYLALQIKACESVCCRPFARLRTPRPCEGLPIRSPLPSIAKPGLLSPCRGGTSHHDERFGTVHRFVSRTGRNALH